MSPTYTLPPTRTLRPCCAWPPSLTVRTPCSPCQMTSTCQVPRHVESGISHQQCQDPLDEASVINMMLSTRESVFSSGVTESVISGVVIDFVHTSNARARCADERKQTAQAPFLLQEGVGVLASMGWGGVG